MSSTPQSADTSAIGYRFALAFAAAAILLILGLAAFGQWRGPATRYSGKSSEIKVVQNSKELLSVWQAAGVRGAILVEASEQFGFQAVTFETIGVPARYPVALGDIRQGYLQHLARDNRLWIASELGMFRTVHYVMEPNAFRVRLEQGRQMGYSGITADGTSIKPNLNGYWREIRPEFPKLSETAVLDVDASYFKSGQPAELAERLKQSGLKFSVITLNRATDDTSTPDAARTQLDEFGRLIGQSR